MPRIVKVLIALAALVVGIILLLFIIALVTGYGSISNLWWHVTEYIKFIWQERIIA